MAESMIEENIAEQVLTVGCDYKNPRGGVAQVLNTYSKMYRPFRFVTTTKRGGRCSHLLTLAICVGRLLYLLPNRRIKIVHIHGSSYNSFFRKLIVIELSKLFGKKVVYHIHGGGFKEFARTHRRVVRHAINRCDAIVALSEAWREYYANELGARRVEVIHNVIPAPIKLHRKHDDMAINMLFLGALNHDKGIYDLLEVIATHKHEFTGRLRLQIGGNGETEQVKQFIECNDIGSVVEFKGWVSGDEKINLLNQSDIYILPSYFEGLPISILEAMSYNMPVISTTVGGIPEIIDDSNGILITPGDKQQLYSAIKRLIENRELISTMGIASYRKVHTYLPDVVCDQLNQLYQSLLYS